MKIRVTAITLASLLFSSAAFACEYRPGETKFLDYAHCLYGTDEIAVVDLPDGSSWERCIYRTQAFMPAKLLAVTRERNGREEATINCRGCIGNPCYLMKSACDAALKTQLAGP